MRIDLIDNAADLASLERDWRSVYDADPDAHYFLSWTWMSKWMFGVVRESIILAVRPDDHSPYCAFWPLRLRTIGIKGGGLGTIISMAGQGASDYTGVLCHPEYESKAIPALVRRIKKLGWRNLVLGAFRASDARMRAILLEFNSRDFVTESLDLIYDDGSDHSVYPHVALPNGWEDYLQTCLSKETRRKVRRFLRQVEGDGPFHITVSNAETLERDLDILFRFWNLKWGAEGAAGYVKAHYEMFRHCSAIGTLFLPIMWQDNRPLGALANLLDDVKQTMLFKIFGRDEEFRNPSPGLILYAVAIREAIARGYRECDFLQGDHRFKYSFGAADRRVFQHRINRRRDGPGSRTLDQSALRAAINYTQTLHKNGRYDEAEQNYKQILTMDPANSIAVSGLRALRDRRGTRARSSPVLARPS